MKKISFAKEHGLLWQMVAAMIATAVPLGLVIRLLFVPVKQFNTTELGYNANIISTKTDDYIESIYSTSDAFAIDPRMTEKLDQIYTNRKTKLLAIQYIKNNLFVVYNLLQDNPQIGVICNLYADIAQETGVDVYLLDENGNLISSTYEFSVERGKLPDYVQAVQNSGFSNLEHNICCEVYELNGWQAILVDSQSVSEIKMESLYTKVLLNNASTKAALFGQQCLCANIQQKGDGYMCQNGVFAKTAKHPLKEKRFSFL